MRSIPTLLFALVFTLRVASQVTVEPSSFGYSNGVHPSFSFVFEGTDAKYVESYWRDELKKISASVSNKKEVIGIAALIPQVSPDTVRVYVKAEQRKGQPSVVAHVAIETTSGFVSPNSEGRIYDGGLAFVQQRSTQLRRQLAEQELSLGERGLAKLRNELDNLKREKERAEANIEKSKQRAAEAVVEQERSRREADDLGPRISALQAELGTTPDKDGQKELSGLIRDRDRALSDNRKAQDTERNMTKKADDLVWEIKKNMEDQSRKSEEIARQETLVGTLKEKLRMIR
ncbi:MAG: hypothetical protein JNM62_01240 [Flavobacteriales bacterium]|nr:hypothetical protein [Flavobacteriales bacterium]